MALRRRLAHKEGTKMRGATKMLMISSRQKDGGDRRRDGEMQQHYPMHLYMPPYGEEPRDNMWYEAEGEVRGGYTEPESRNYRRYKNGRFAPRSEMDMYEPMGRGGSERRGTERTRSTRPMQIGFRYEEDETRFRADANYPRMNESEHRTSRMERGGAEVRGYANLDEETAKEWVSKMRGSDGSDGGHWSMDQAKQVLKQKNMDCDPVEFFALLNMLYSDYSQLAKTYGVNSVDFYADMAKAFLDDEDAVDNKLMAYYECVVSR